MFTAARQQRDSELSFCLCFLIRFAYGDTWSGLMFLYSMVREEIFDFVKLLQAQRSFDFKGAAQMLQIFRKEIISQNIVISKRINKFSYLHDFCYHKIKTQCNFTDVWLAMDSSNVKNFGKIISKSTMCSNDAALSFWLKKAQLNKLFELQTFCCTIFYIKNSVQNEVNIKFPFSENPHKKVEEKYCRIFLFN